MCRASFIVAVAARRRLLFGHLDRPVHQRLQLVLSRQALQQVENGRDVVCSGSKGRVAKMLFGSQPQVECGSGESVC